MISNFVNRELGHYLKGNVTFGEKLTLQRLCESCIDDKTKGGEEGSGSGERENEP